jgi:uncharacterized protein YkwD
MRARTLAAPLLSLVALAATPVGAAGSTACPGDDRASTGLEAAAALVCDINVLRARNDLAPVGWNWRLRLSAQDLADDMAANHFIGHVSSDGRTLWDRVAATGYFDGAPAPVVLENVDWGSSPYSTPLATASGWMDSAAHRAHLLDPDVEEIGIGIAEGAVRSDGVDGLFYVADFGTRGKAIDDDGLTLVGALTPRESQTTTHASTITRRCRPKHKRARAGKRSHRRRACRR